MAFDHRDGVAASPYAPVMGRTFVDFDETGPLTVLDERRAALLSAWATRIIPADGPWPAAGDLDTVAYIDAVLRKARELRPVVLAGIDAVDAAASAAHDAPFAELDEPAQIAILQEAEKTTAPVAFSIVLELTYEAYYRAPSVQQVVKDVTGFDVRNTVDGKKMAPFPTERMLEVGARPDRFRSVPA
ncbi:gluconate 2-dehydrogenase subunit 3 family protein [Microbacterium sp. CJ88]|uniref:gluconate 2-dehydrogenase subunit 3 family protein n=1 Tax=Microbacterium sp. CJ88 TaxID=3445672 RepID=UPI003F65CAAF